MGVHPLAHGDVARGEADRLAVFSHGLALCDRHDGQLVAQRHPGPTCHVALTGDDPLTGLDAPRGNADVVVDVKVEGGGDRGGLCVFGGACQDLHRAARSRARRHGG